MHETCSIFFSPGRKFNYFSYTIYQLKPRWRVCIACWLRKHLWLIACLRLLGAISAAVYKTRARSIALSGSSGCYYGPNASYTHPESWSQAALSGRCSGSPLKWKLTLCLCRKSPNRIIPNRAASCWWWMDRTKILHLGLRAYTPCLQTNKLKSLRSSQRHCRIKASGWKIKGCEIYFICKTECFLWRHYI